MATNKPLDPQHDPNSEFYGMDPGLIGEYQRQQKALSDIGSEATTFQDIAGRAAGRVREVDPYYQKLLSGELGDVRSQAASALAAGQAAAGRGAANYGNILSTSLAAGQKEAKIAGEVGEQKYNALLSAQQAADQAQIQANQAQEKYSQAAMEKGGLEDLKYAEIEKANQLIDSAMAHAKSESSVLETNKSYARRWLINHLGDVRTQAAYNLLMNQINSWS